MIVVDTGPLVAMANEQDRYHVRCVEWFDVAPRPLLVSVPILTEVCYLLERERGAMVEAAFLGRYGMRSSPSSRSRAPISTAWQSWSRSIPACPWVLLTHR